MSSFASKRSVVLVLVSCLLLLGCNQNPVVLLDGSAGVFVKKADVGGQVPMDILWVIDNSFSMCQEQKTLRDNFDVFAEELGKTNLDFHISVTTTHAPRSGVVYQTDAIEGYLQSKPEPAPGRSAECIEGEGDFDGVETRYVPFRDALAAAMACAEPGAVSAQDYVWSDDEIACARLSTMAQDASGCRAALGLDGVAGEDGILSTDDLFPPSEVYREIPKVLRAQDYVGANGRLDTERLRADFACMSLVGTRGDGYEKGLLAATVAVSRELTGGALGVSAADESKPNHGFLRDEANFTVIFVSDENDCSHDGSMPELGQSCGSDLCDYYNSALLEPEQTPLYDPANLAEALRQNLSESKGREVLGSEIYAAGIMGTSRRFDETFSPSQCEGTRQIEKLPFVCQSDLGSAASGDRYERFIRQFENHYPNSVVEQYGEEARLDFSRVEPVGWMCSTTFAPVLSALGSFISGSRVCVEPDLLSECEVDADCPLRPFSDDGEVPGRCVSAQGSEDGRRWCDTGLTLVIQRQLGGEALYEQIEEHPFCERASLGELGIERACVVKPAFYTMARRCSGSRSLQVEWSEDADAQRLLSGYELRLVLR